MPSPLVVMLGTGLVLFTVGAIGFVRERRRLSTMVLMLAGLASGGMATLVLLADSAPPLPFSSSLELLSRCSELRTNGPRMRQ